MFRSNRNDFRELVRVPPVISIEKRDVSSPRRSDAEVSRCGDTARFAAQITNAVTKLLLKQPCGIIVAVIDNQNLEHFVRLLENAPNGPYQLWGTIESRNDNRDERLLVTQDDVVR